MPSTDSAERLRNIGIALPKTKLASADSRDGRTLLLPVSQALAQPFISINDEWRTVISGHDVDADGISWDEFAALEQSGAIPTATAKVPTQHGFHVYYALRTPILIGANARRAPVWYLADMRAGFNALIGADISYNNLRMRNPVYSGVVDSVAFIGDAHRGYALAELYSDAIKQAQFDLRYERKTRTRRTRRATSQLIEQLRFQARNVALGNRNDFLALPIRRSGLLWRLAETEIEPFIESLNASLAEPLGAKEVGYICVSLRKSHGLNGYNGWRKRRKGGVNKAKAQSEAHAERDSYLIQLAELPISQTQKSAQLAAIGKQLHGDAWIREGYQLSQSAISRALKRLKSGGAQVGF